MKSFYEKLKEKKRKQPGSFKAYGMWQKRNNITPEQYYQKKIQFHLEALQKYLERVIVKNAAPNIDEHVRVRLVYLYAEILKAHQTGLFEGFSNEN